MFLGMVAYSHNYSNWEAETGEWGEGLSEVLFFKKAYKNTSCRTKLDHIRANEH